MMGIHFNNMGIVYMLTFWVIIITLAIWLLSHLFPRVTDSSSSPSTTQHGDLPESPLEILRRRYARGEISKAEYEEMRRELLK